MVLLPIGLFAYGARHSPATFWFGVALMVVHGVVDVGYFVRRRQLRAQRLVAREPGE